MSFKFRKWRIYSEARGLRKEVIREIVSQIPKEEKFGLISQLRRALTSIVLNIAEGAYRESDKDLAHFLNQAETSLNEVVSCFDICYDDGYISVEDVDRFSEKAENLVNQIIAFRKKLKA